MLFDRPATARRLAAVAGACRLVWNEMLDQQAPLCDIARMCGATPPSPTFFMLGKAFTQLRRVTPWLQAMPYGPVRYTLKYQADAWRRFFRGEAGRPRFKKRGRDSVTIPQDVRIRDGKLWFPTIGWLRLRHRGGNPYPDAEPVQAALKRVNGKWMHDAKSGWRSVPLTPAVAHVLAGIPRREDNPWVITGQQRGSHLKSLDDIWQRLGRRAGLVDVRIHDCRHSYASRALVLGEGLTMIGRLLGHAKVETTARYAHLARDSVRQSAVLISDSVADEVLGRG